MILALAFAGLVGWLLGTTFASRRRILPKGTRIVIGAVKNGCVQVELARYAYIFNAEDSLAMARACERVSCWALSQRE